MADNQAIVRYFLYNVGNRIKGKGYYSNFDAEFKKIQ